MRSACVLLVVFSIGLAGCNVINPELLERSDGMPADAAKATDAGLDSPPDAYVPYEGNLASNPGLETGNTLGWTTNGGSAQIALSTEQAYAGTRSLLTTNRTGEWNGPAVSIVDKVRPGKRYFASVWARHTSATNQTFSVSTKHLCAESGEERFNTNTTRTAAVGNDTSWVQPSSMFTVVNTAECTLTAFLVYVETSGSDTGAFYVDDIDIREIP